MAGPTTGIGGAAAFRLITSSNFRGRGDSSAPPTRWSPEAHHADLQAVLTAYHVTHVHLVAHSIGVGYALGFAELHPGTVLSVVAGDYVPWVGQVSTEWVTMVDSGGVVTTSLIPGGDSFPLTRDYRPFLASNALPVLVLQRTRGPTPEQLANWLTIWSSAKHARVHLVDSGHDVFASASAVEPIVTFLRSVTESSQRPSPAPIR